MPRSTITPLATLESMIPTDFIVDTEATLATLCAAFRQLLLAEGCECNGHARGRERDPNWDNNITQLVARAQPHEIFHQDPTSALWIPETVSIKLHTMRVEVDDNDEVCCWMYEES